MANRYWININGGNWNDTANWSDTSGGSGGSSVPTSSDNVFIDAASFNATGKTITINATANMLNFDCSAADVTFTIANSAYAFNVYGNLVLGTNLLTSFTSTGYLYFKSTSTGKTITANSCTQSFNRIYFDGSGGQWTNQDAWNMGSSAVYLTNGTWITGNNNITTTGTFNTATGTKALTLGTMVFSIGAWQNTTALNFTFTPNSSTVTITTASTLTGANTFYNLTFTGTAAVTAQILLASSITVSNTFTPSGNNATNYRLLVASNTIGTARTITAANVSCSNVDFRDITGAGAGSWNLSAITGLSGDCGGNSGITFTTPQKQYFKHTSGAVNWSDATKWFSDDSPRTTAGRVPLPQDDVQFDASSFSGTSTLTVNCPRIGKNLDMSAVDDAVTMTKSNHVESYGSFVLGNNITHSGSANNYLIGYNDSGLIINTYNKTLYAVICYAVNSKYTLQSDFTSSITLSVYVSNSLSSLGILDFNDYNVTTRGIVYGNNYEKGVYYLGNGTITLNVAGGGFTMHVNNTVYCEQSTIKITAADAQFAGAGKTYNKLWYSGTSASNCDITGSNTFAELVIDAGRKVRVTAGTTQQIGKFTATGTAGSGITIGSVTSASHTLNYTGSDEVECDYLTLSYSTATPSNKWYAGDNSTDGGNNTGWMFYSSFKPIICFM